jgi:hypothetical protein
MIPVKTRPAITVTGDMGAAEGLGVTFFVSAGEIVVVKVSFSKGVEMGEGVTVGTTPA